MEAWRSQHTALAAPHYRVTVVPRKSGDKPYNLGKTDDGERFYTADQVEGLIPRLRGYNARGYDVYLSPIDPRYHYLLIDHMTRQQLDRLSQAELEPCLVQKSGANNFQVILKVPKVERADEQSLAGELCAHINRNFGDPKLSGTIHPFRMAGFSNREQGQHKAFTGITNTTAANRVCQVSADLLDRMRRQTDQENALAEQELAERDERMGMPDDPDSDVVAEYRRLSSNHESPGSS